MHSRNTSRYKFYLDLDLRRLSGVLLRFLSRLRLLFRSRLLLRLLRLRSRFRSRDLDLEWRSRLRRRRSRERERRSREWRSGVRLRLYKKKFDLKKHIQLERLILSQMNCLIIETQRCTELVFFTNQNKLCF